MAGERQVAPAESTLQSTSKNTRERSRLARHAKATLIKIRNQVSITPHAFNGFRDRIVKHRVKLSNLHADALCKND